MPEIQRIFFKKLTNIDMICKHQNVEAHFQRSTMYAFKAFVKLNVFDVM